MSDHNWISRIGSWLNRTMRVARIQIRRLLLGRRLHNEERRRAELADRGTSFGDIFRRELEQIKTRRIKQNYLTQAQEPGPDSLVGLALSGGGIRSATFCLGLLQGMHEHQLLRMFDYLSTVSGGGFTGAWWSAFLSRRPRIPVPLDRKDAQIASQRFNALVQAMPDKLRINPETCALEALAPLSDEDALRIEQGLNGLDHPDCLSRVLRDLSRRQDQLFPGLEAIEPDTLAAAPPAQPMQQVSTEVQREPTRAASDAGCGSAVAAPPPPDPVHHLRLFANYLTPRKGALSPDTWRAVAVISRNLLLNWLILMPLLLSCLLLGRTYFLLSALTGDTAQLQVSPRSLFKPPSTQANPTSQPSTLIDALSLRIDAGPPYGLSTSFTVTPHPTPQAPKTSPLYRKCLLSRLRFASAPPLLLLGLILFMSLYWLWGIIALPGDFWTRCHAWGVMALFVVLIGVLPYEIFVKQLDGLSSETWTLWKVVGVLLLVGAVGLTLYTHRGFHALDPRLDTTAGAERLWNQIIRVHAKLLVFLAATVLVLAAAGFGHDLVDWTFRRAKGIGIGTLLTTLLGAILTAVKNSPTGGGDRRTSSIDSLGWRIVFSVTPWAVVAALILLGAYAIHVSLESICRVYAGYELASGVDLEGQRHVLWSIAAAPAVCGIGFLITAGHFFQRNSPSQRGMPRHAAPAPATTPSQNSPILARRFAAGGIASIAIFAFVAMTDMQVSGNGHFLVALHLVALVTLIGIVIILGMVVDPNAISIHPFYRARLIRGYLGASNPERPAHRSVTEAADGDDLPLHDLLNVQRGAPYPLINATLNLVGSRDLSTSNRTARPFLFSPLYCGNRHSGFRSTHEYKAGRTTLGTAVAVSGAAVSPNSGANSQSAAVAMMLTICNVRLGYWAPNPARRRWRSSKPALWPYYVLREFLSLTNDLSTYVYLTDGGHFDNTSLYSLIERGCRLIVLADCGADPETCFQDLGDAMRR